MVSKEIEEKRQRLLRVMSNAGLGGVLISSQANFSWLTAGGTNGIDLSREGGAGTLFLRRDGVRFVLASKIEMDRLFSEELDGQGYQPIEFAWEQEKAKPSLVANLARSLVMDELPLGTDLPLGDDVRLVDGAIARARYELTSAEVDRFKTLGRDAGKAIGDVARKLEPGLTEREVAQRAIDALAAVGANSVVTLVAADDRLKRFRHPVPTDLKWKKVVMIVVCARRSGLIASLSRIVCDGPIREDLSIRTRGSAFVNARLFDGTKPGVTGRELYELAALAYDEAGFPGEERLHHSFIAGVVGWVDLTDPDMEQELEVLTANPKFKGVRHLVESEPADDWLVQPAVLNGLQVLGKHRVSYDLLVHTRHLKHVKTVAEACPNLRLVIDHMAKPPIASREIADWAKELKEVAAYPNTSCKLSGLVTEANWSSWTIEDLRPYVDPALEFFGPKRMMFGSDWPVCLQAASYNQVLDSFRSLLANITKEDRARVLGGNAIEFYRLREEADQAGAGPASNSTSSGGA